MNTGMNLEIHFHQQDEASVYLESTESGEHEDFVEILLFTLYSLRQMANLGYSVLSTSLADVLSNISIGINEIASGYEVGGVKLIRYGGSPGRKCFIAKLRLSENNFSFDLRTKGFGIFARGMGYYAPTSVMVLLRHLAMKRSEDIGYLHKISRAAEMCSEIFKERKLTLSNQNQLALSIATIATTAANST